MIEFFRGQPSLPQPWELVLPAEGYHGTYPIKRDGEYLGWQVIGQNPKYPTIKLGQSLNRILVFNTYKMWQILNTGLEIAQQNLTSLLERVDKDRPEIICLLEGMFDPLVSSNSPPEVKEISQKMIEEFGERGYDLLTLNQVFLYKQGKPHRQEGLIVAVKKGLKIQKIEALPQPTGDFQKFDKHAGMEQAVAHLSLILHLSGGKKIALTHMVANTSMEQRLRHILDILACKPNLLVGDLNPYGFNTDEGCLNSPFFTNGRINLPFILYGLKNSILNICQLLPNLSKLEVLRIRAEIQKISYDLLGDYEQTTLNVNLTGTLTNPPEHLKKVFQIIDKIVTRIFAMALDQTITSEPALFLRELFKIGKTSDHLAQMITFISGSNMTPGTRELPARDIDRNN